MQSDQVMENLKSRQLSRERWDFLLSLKNLLGPFMDLLAFLWLILTIMELTQGLTPLLNSIVTIIWVLFVMHFTLEFIVAPAKMVYLKHNWLTAISLALPAVRIFRFFRFFRYLRFVRGASFIKILSTMNRGMRTLRKSLAKKAFLYVVSLTLVMILCGAAGILYFEKDSTDYFTGYASALWWSSMMITTMGADFFPKSPEGRALTLVLAVYGFAVFGYVAATVASVLIRKEKESPADETRKELLKLRSEIQEIKRLLKN